MSTSSCYCRRYMPAFDLAVLALIFGLLGMMVHERGRIGRVGAPRLTVSSGKNSRLTSPNSSRSWTGCIEQLEIHPPLGVVTSQPTSQNDKSISWTLRTPRRNPSQNRQTCRKSKTRPIPPWGWYRRM